MEPSKIIIQQALKTAVVTDGVGRELTIKNPNALDTLRLLKAAGPVLSQNEAWLGMAGLAFAVVAIDSVPVPQPTTEAQIENLVERLGDDGMAAVSSVLNRDTATTGAPAELGNLHGTQS